MTWHRLTLNFGAPELPRIEALLELAGAESITVTDEGDEPILEPAPGTTPLWSELRVSALFDGRLDIDAIAGMLRDAGSEPSSIERIDQADVEAAARQSVPALDVGPRLAIVPAEAFDATDPRQVGLNMGLAFGTGQHPTTRLCLQWLERADVTGATVLDYGAGSGVLALAALRLGADRATAIDNDPQAVEAARRNAVLNGALSRLRVGPPESLGRDSFDLILANILARPLVGLAATFAARQAPAGRVVLSGILASQLDEVEDAYSGTYRDFSRCVDSGWGLLTAERRSG